jgi:2-methylisocitrate lyase-like PEP mutase family enzyme
MSPSPNGTPKSKSARLKELIYGNKILVVPGVFDGFSCRVVQDAGFDHAAISGAGTSESRLGKPDVGIMGLEDNLQGARSMAACVDIPLMADADTGYGNAINVFFTVQAFESAGIAGIMIEDQEWPKRCGHMAGKEVISAEEMVQKIKAAVEAKRDPNFVIKARTDATATHGIDEAIRRGNMYAEAGADLLFADALLSAADIEKFVKNVPKPAAVNMGFGIRQRKTTPLLSAKQLEDLGVAVVNLPRMLTAAAIKGMQNAIAAYKESLETGKVVDRPDLLVSFEELNDLMGFQQIKDMEQRFLTEEQLASKYGR